MIMADAAVLFISSMCLFSAKYLIIAVKEKPVSLCHFITIGLR